MLTHCNISNLSCVVRTRGIAPYQSAIELVDFDMTTIRADLENLRIVGGYLDCIFGSNLFGSIKNCIITETGDAISISATVPQSYAVYENNYIRANEYLLNSGAWLNGPKTTLRNNILVGGNGHIYGGFEADTCRIYNNLFFSDKYSGNVAIIVGDLTYIYNNVIYSTPEGQLKAGITTFNDKQYIYNNIIIGCKYGVESREGEANPNIRYNNFWKNDINFYNFPNQPDSTNIYRDPMFEDLSTQNLHLQLYSPMIDAGDPDVLDVDGTRSDLGYYGGPYGESYRYQDIAPVKPQSLVQ